jgi:hypothetical protein
LGAVGAAMVQRGECVLAVLEAIRVKSHLGTRSGPTSLS